MVPGVAQGDVLCLDEPLSFWGGLDPGTGRIIASREVPNTNVAAPASNEASSAVPNASAHSPSSANGPAFAASTGVDLRLNDDATTEIGGDRLGLLGGSGNLAVRDSNPVGAQQLLALEFVDLHRDSR